MFQSRNRDACGGECQVLANGNGIASSFNLVIEMLVVERHSSGRVHSTIFRFQSRNRDACGGETPTGSPFRIAHGFQSRNRDACGGENFDMCRLAVRTSCFNLVIEMLVVERDQPAAPAIGTIRFNLVIEMLVVESIVKSACLPSFSCFNLVIEMLVVERRRLTKATNRHGRFQSRNRDACGGEYF